MSSDYDDKILKRYHDNYNEIPPRKLVRTSDEVFEMVLEQGYDPNKLDKQFNDSLIYFLDGANRGDIAKIKIVIKYGADINKLDSCFGETVLHSLISSVNYHNDKNMEFLTFLLDNGANVWVEDADGRTVFDVLNDIMTDEDYNTCFCHQIGMYDDGEQCGNCCAMEYCGKQVTVLHNYLQRNRSFFELMLPLLTTTNNKIKRVY